MSAVPYTQVFYQLDEIIWVYSQNIVLTGDRESGFDSGEAA